MRYRVEPFNFRGASGHWVISGEGWARQVVKTFTTQRYGAETAALAEAEAARLNAEDEASPAK